MNKKRTLWAVRIILIALIVCWMMTIFDFSAANGQQSQSYSDGITIKIIRLIKKDCNMLSKDRQQEYFNQVSFFVRKTGHFGEYGILSLLWSGFLLSFESIRKIKKKESFLKCWNFRIVRHRHRLVRILNFAVAVLIRQ